MNKVDRWFRTRLFHRLEDLTDGHLLIHDQHETFNFGIASGLKAEITVEKTSFYKILVLKGHLGATEAFANNLWNSPDLTRVIRLLLRNRDILDDMDKGPVRLLSLVRKFLHHLRKNSYEGSKRNIAFHYDLGNELFHNFLDPTLSYSCAIFDTEEATLEEASIAKYDRICRKLNVKSKDRIIEIGSGWGGFAIYAATNYDCHVTTATISRNQFNHVSKVVKEKGLMDQVKPLFCDYRNLQGQFDHLVSIEMIEAIGHNQYKTFFDKCSSLLTDQGMVAIQAITIQNRYYEQARREIDFIKAYIFPGSCIPSVATLFNAMSHTDLRLLGSKNIGPHYAKTLNTWKETFLRNETQIAQLGYDTFFRKIWEMYFSYCEGGFLEGVLEDHQLILAKPSAGLEIHKPPNTLK